MSSCGLPGPPWVPESSGGAGPVAELEAEARGFSVTPWGTEGLPEEIGPVGFRAGVGEEARGAGPGAGLEVEARGVSVIPWGTEGLLQRTSSVGLGAGVGEESGGAGPNDMFWVVTSEVQGPPSTGIGTWAGGLGDAVPLGWGATGPAEAEVLGPRVPELSSVGSGLTCSRRSPTFHGVRRTEAGAYGKEKASLGFQGTAPAAAEWPLLAWPCSPIADRAEPSSGQGELLNPPGRAWMTSEPPSISAQSLVPEQLTGPPPLRDPGLPAQP